jgi:hypothetical protein
MRAGKYGLMVSESSKSGIEAGALAIGRPHCNLKPQKQRLA